MIGIDFDADEVSVTGRDGERRYALASREAFALLTEAWLRAGWANRYSYTFSWFGRPVIQLPEDLIRLQELVHQLKPDVIVETGIAYGGSTVFLAGLCRLNGRGRVVGVDIDIRPHNRAALETHDFASSITLIEGNSTAPGTIAQVRDRIGAEETVLVLLDSDHCRAHVLAELEAYTPLIKPGGYVVVADGVMGSLAGLPGANADWSWNNPKAAVAAFLAVHRDFERAGPPLVFNEGGVPTGGSYWPDGWLRRRC